MRVTIEIEGPSRDWSHSLNGDAYFGSGEIEDAIAYLDKTWSEIRAGLVALMTKEEQSRVPMALLAPHDQLDEFLQWQRNVGQAKQASGQEGQKS